MRALLPLAAAIAVSCATYEPVHVLPADRAEGESFWCLSPEGALLPWRHDTDPPTCPAPAHFVRVPICLDGRTWQPDDRAELRAARVEAGRDGTAYGDSFEGEQFCLEPPPR